MANAFLFFCFRPILSSLLNRLEVLASKLDRLGEAQIQIQKSFNIIESRYTLSPPGLDDVPQCGRRVDRVLRTLTPLVSRVEGLWNIVSSAGKVPDRTINPPPSQFLNGPPPADVLLSESRRQERAISAIKSDLNIRVSYATGLSIITQPIPYVLLHICGRKLT